MPQTHDMRVGSIVGLAGSVTVSPKSSLQNDRPKAYNPFSHMLMYILAGWILAILPLAIIDSFLLAPSFHPAKMN
jgi:hypothetical protein